MKFFLIIACMFATLCYGGESKHSSSSKKPTLMLYYSPSCPYCAKVINHLKKMGKTVPMTNVQQYPKKREELKKIGGRGTIPCLIINKKAMYESQVIIKWLSDHPNDLDPA
jgi:glutaredoxin 3